MNEEKRIYSLNLATYVFLTTGIFPIVRKEENEEVYYCVFPEVDQVGKAINHFRNVDCVVNIHNYLNAYRTIREVIKEIREGDA